MTEAVIDANDKLAFGGVLAAAVAPSFSTSAATDAALAELDYSLLDESALSDEG